MRLEVEPAAAVGDDMVLVLVAPHRHAAALRLEQVRRRHRVERKHLARDDRGEPWRCRVELEQQVEGRRADRRQRLAQPLQPKAGKAGGKGEEVAQQRKAAKRPSMRAEQRVLLPEPDLLQHVRRHDPEMRITERVEIADGDALAVGEELLVDGHRVDVGAEQMRPAACRSGASLTGAPAGVTPGLSSSSRAVRWRKRQPQPRRHAGRDLQPERLQRRRRRVVLGGLQMQRPQLERARQPVAAGDAALLLDIDGIDIGRLPESAARP